MEKDNKKLTSEIQQKESNVSNTPFISCKNCIHISVCGALKAYVDANKQFEQIFPFVKLTTNPENIAQGCKEFKTLSDVLLRKDDNESN